MEIRCLKIFLFFQHCYLDKRFRYCQHRGMTHFCLMSVVNHLYIDIYRYIGISCIKYRSDPKVDPCGTPQFIGPVPEKKFSSVTKSFLFERYSFHFL